MNPPLADGRIGRYGIRWLLVIIKMITSLMLLGTNLFIRNCICPLVEHV